MNWKSIFSIIALLTIGFLAGFTTHRHLTVQATERIAVLRLAKGMENRLYKTLQLDEEQKENLVPIISKHFEEVAQINRAHRANRIKMLATLKSKISPFLNEKQKEKLEKFSNRLKKTGHKKRIPKEKRSNNPSKKKEN
jgi:dsDNA-binding SOS-regulon protein